MNLVVIICWSYINNITGFKEERSAWSYCNPFVIIEAIFVFMIFKSIKLKSKIINKLARGCFFTFLLHTKFYNFIGIELFVKKHFLVMIIHIIVSAVSIYLICYICFIIYEKISTPIFNFLKNKIGLLETNVK